MTDPVVRTHTAPGTDAPLEHANRRLQALVSELIQTNQELRQANQELRFRNALLEEQEAKLKRGLKDASAWAGVLF